MRIIAGICLLVISSSVWGQARRAENLIEKEKYESAFEVIISGMERDSSDAALPFVLSTLYLTKAWPQANLDSAYYFSVLSIEKYDQLDEKNLDKHIKDGFGKTRLVELKEHIDHLAFERAKGGGKEADYQQFMDQHTDAHDLDSAIYLRNEQAFLKASNLNTRASYKYFLNNYPEAADWQEADARYQKILYNEITTSGKLKEYLRFVKSYPKSPYYEQAVNNIYRIEIGENTTEALLGFVDNYPNTQAAQKAIGLLYHKHLEMEPARSFADKYPRLQISDSLKEVISHQGETLLPIWNASFIRFVNLEQKTCIDSLTSIEPFERYSDFISARKNGKQLLINSSGLPFYQGSWQHVEELGSGFIVLSGKTQNTVVHKNGSNFSIGKEPAFVGPFLSYRYGDKWGLVSVTGKNISQPRYDSTWFQNGLIFLEQEDKISPNLPQVFYPALDGETYKTGPFYEDYEWLNDTLLWVTGNNKEGLFNQALEVLEPYQKQRIDLALKGWTVTRKGKVQNPAFSTLAFDKFEENDHWQIGSSKDSLIVKYNYSATFQPDSAFLLGPASIEMRWSDSTFVYLTDTVRFYKPDDATVRPMLDQTNDAAFYEVVEKKKHTLVNRKGQALDLPKYTEVSPLNASFFLFKDRKLYDLYNSYGEKLLENLEGAALINDSTLSILQEQKFGVFRPGDSLYIAPSYEKKPMPLIDSLWVVSQDDRYGIISSNGNEKIGPLYEEINYWTNGLVFLKKDMKWNLYDLKTSNFSETGIVKFSSLQGTSTPTIVYQKGVGTGIFSSETGIILRPTYSSIQRKGTKAQPYYLADKYVEEASLHVLLYYDIKGQLLFQKVISDAQFKALFKTTDY